EHLPAAGVHSWADVEDVLPCSPMQQGILISQLKAPTTYRVTQTCRVRTTDSALPVDVARLEGAWRCLVARHTILRTVFIESLPNQQGFFQLVLGSPQAHVVRLECEEGTGPQACVAAQAALEYCSGTLPHRFTVVTTAAGDVYCHLEVSHALVDASSIELLIRELLEAYDGRLADGPAPRYSAYVAFLQKRPANEDLRYWEDLLADAEPCHLPRLDPGPGAAAEAEHATPATVSAQLKNLAALAELRERHGLTLANLFQLAWALVLAARTGSDQVCFGYLSSGRDAAIPGAPELVGPMINMMTCYFHVERGMTVLDAARAVQDRFLKGFEHQRTPLADVQHALRLSRQPLFNTTVSYKRKAAASPDALPRSIALESLASEDPTEYEVGVTVVAGKDAVDVALQYSPGLLSAASAEDLLAQLVSTLDSLSRRPHARLGELSQLSGRDVAKIRAWNGSAPARSERCLHDL
ncbi:hypothetical protein LTR49_028817, partial [Elasticomyces elasticus]